MIMNVVPFLINECLFSKENRGSQYASMIIDFSVSPPQLRTNYPLEMEGKGVFDDPIGNYYVCAGPLESLTSVQLLKYESDMKSVTAAAATPTKVNVHPICCPSSVKPYRAIRTDRDAVFSSFLSSHGNHNDIVYRVVTKVNNGPVIGTTYHQLIDNTIVNRDGPYNDKIHSYKNYV
jgi:hypothetical protein